MSARAARARRLLAATVVGLTLLAPAPASAAAPSGELQAFAELAGCVASGHPLYAQFVVDESQSLEDTDPQGTRREALLTAVEALSDLQTPQSPVYASLATFASEYVPRVGWDQLSGGHRAELLRFADEQVPALHKGVETDYLAALQGAASSMRTAVGTADACRAVFFFTDGGLDLRAGAAATADAARQLCDAHGTADALRQQGVHLLAFGLLTRDGDGSVTAADRQRLQALAVGEAGDETCGSTPITAPRAAGAYLAADDADLLSGLFDGAVARIGGFTGSDAVSCPGAACPGGVVSFPVDRGVRAVRLLVAGGAPGMSLRAPDGSSAAVDGGATQLAGAGVVSRVRAGAVRVDLEVPPDAPSGVWSLDVGAAPATVQVYRSSGLSLRLDPAAHLRAGEPSAVGVAVVDQQGRPAVPGDWSTFELTGRADGRAVPFVRDGDGWSGPLTLPRTGFPASVALELSLRLVTAPSGVPLDPVTSTTTLPVTPPTGFPSLGQSALDLPTIEGLGSATATLELLGSDQGPTEVCFGAPDVSGPAGAGSISLVAPPGCLQLPRDGRAGAAVTVTPAAAADGVVVGTLPVTLRGAEPGDETVVPLPVHVALTRPVDEATRWALVVALVLGALALPLLVLGVLGRRAARLRYDVLKVADVPVVVTATGLRRPDSVAPLELLPADFSHRTPPSGERRYDVTPAAVLVAYTSRRRLFAPTAALQALPGWALAGARTRTATRAGRAELDLGAPYAWVLVADAQALPERLEGEDWQVAARLVALRGQDGPESLHRLADDVDRFERWDRLAERLLAQRAHPPAAVEPAVARPLPDASRPLRDEVPHLDADGPRFLDAPALSSRTRGSDDAPPAFL